jgi:hypothetical protein
MKNVKIVLSILLLVSIFLILNTEKIQAQTKPDSKIELEKNSNQDYNLLQLIVLQELEHYGKFPFQDHYTENFDSVNYCLDSTFITGHNLISSGYLYWPMDTVEFSVGFRLNENSGVFSLEYYQMDLCFKKETGYSATDIRIGYNGDIQGCVKGNHTCLSPTEFYRKSVPFKILNKIKESD